jgi:hypothetical protein
MGTVEGVKKMRDNKFQKALNIMGLKKSANPLLTGEQFDYIMSFAIFPDCNDHWISAFKLNLKDVLHYKGLIISNFNSNIDLKVFKCQQSDCQSGAIIVADDIRKAIDLYEKANGYVPYRINEIDDDEQVIIQGMIEPDVKKDKGF